MVFGHFNILKSKNLGFNFDLFNFSPKLGDKGQFYMIILA
jgi:hypothetical protein